MNDMIECEESMYRVSDAMLRRVLHDIYNQRANEDSRQPNVRIYREKSLNEIKEHEKGYRGVGYYLAFCIHDIFKGFPCKSCRRNHKEAKHFFREFCATHGISID